MVEMVEDFGYMDMMENPENSKKYFWFSYLEPLISQLINSMRLRNFQKEDTKIQIENCLLGQFKSADTVVCWD